jgi:hypothetical protein
MPTANIINPQSILLFRIGIHHHHQLSHQKTSLPINILYRAEIWHWQSDNMINPTASTNNDSADWSSQNQAVDNGNGTASVQTDQSTNSSNDVSANAAKSTPSASDTPQPASGSPVKPTAAGEGPPASQPLPATTSQAPTDAPEEPWEIVDDKEVAEAAALETARVAKEAEEKKRADELLEVARVRKEAWEKEKNDKEEADQAAKEAEIKAKEQLLQKAAETAIAQAKAKQAASSPAKPAATDDTVAEEKEESPKKKELPKWMVEDANAPPSPHLRGPVWASSFYATWRAPSCYCTLSRSLRMVMRVQI